MSRKQVEPTKTVNFRPVTPELERKQREAWNRIFRQWDKEMREMGPVADDDVEVSGPYTVEQLTETHGRVMKDGQAIKLSAFSVTLENCRIAASALNEIYWKRERGHLAK